MPQIILKPVMWNPDGYLRPAGYPAKGYPEDNGFGHEEWNNSPRMAYPDDGVGMRAFHTERVWKAGDPAAARERVVMMYASHDGVQDLVGVAARARCLVDDEQARGSLAGRLKLGTLAPSAWRQPAVKAAYEGDRDAFQASWDKGLSWIPNWTCPADHYFQPASPVRLDSRRIRNTSKLLTMFNSYTAVDGAAGIRVLLSVRHAERDACWSRVAGLIGEAGEGTAADDIDDVGDDPGLDATTKQALIAARRGQGRFRKQVSAR